MLDNTTLLEILAVITGIISVWLTKKENVLLYPVGIISVLLWIYLCWVGKLFGQSVINFFFFVMNVFGWINWSAKNDFNESKVVIKNNSFNENLLVLFISAILSIIIVFILIPLQDANSHLLFVVVEAIITALNFVAMWLMAWKRIEHWILWIIGDLMCIPLFVYKEYPLGVVQFVFFIIIAYLGYKEWKVKLETQ